MKNAVILLLDGKEFQIRFTMNDIIRLEEILGKGVAEFNPKSFKELRAMVYVAVKPRFKSLDETGDFMDYCSSEIGLEELIKKVVEALTLSMGKLTKQAQK